MISGWGWAGLALVMLVGCGGGEEKQNATPPTSAPERQRVVFLGTSLTAGLGLDVSEAYPALIQQKIDSAGLPFQAVNAGVSGETSAGAVRRLDWVLKEPVAVLVVETGANDGLRGQNVDSLEANIQTIVDRARALSPAPRIVLVGMRMLSNYGAAYVRRFEAVYPELARRDSLPLIPFLLEGVAGIDSLNQADQIHPTAAGQRIVAETVWRTLKPILADAAPAVSASGRRHQLGQGRDGGVDLAGGIVVVR